MVPARTRRSGPTNPPEVLRQFGTMGTVIVSVLITKEGLVQDPIVIQSAHPALEKAVVEAVLKWHVKPPRTISGKKISGRMVQPFNFLMYEGGRRSSLRTT
jgi:TonB family protein